MVLWNRKKCCYPVFTVKCFVYVNFVLFVILVWMCSQPSVADIMVSILVTCAVMLTLISFLPGDEALARWGGRENGIWRVPASSIWTKRFPPWDALNLMWLLVHDCGKASLNRKIAVLFRRLLPLLTQRQIFAVVVCPFCGRKCEVFNFSISVSANLTHFQRLNLGVFSCLVLTMSQLRFAFIFLFTKNTE